MLMGQILVTLHQLSDTNNFVRMVPTKHKAVKPKAVDLFKEIASFDQRPKQQDEMRL